MMTRAFALVLACSLGCAPAFREPSGPSPDPGTEYLVRLAVDGVPLPELTCTKNPVEVRTEPPYYLIDCPPTELALTPESVVDLSLVLASSGEDETWPGLAAPQFLRRTQTSVTSTAAGDEFPDWDGHAVTFRGLDLSAMDVPGSPYR
ncbi:MAG: hypothetical protein JXB32_09320 [Deltaproteobacteria bacterium]|nr:hypothetical protein [Deltaproteobacteria bacterium]